MPDHPCHHCGQGLAECRTPVDHRFPAEARAAYKAAGLTDAATCRPGMDQDFKITGWSYERARFDRRWQGVPMTPAERKGYGVEREKIDRARGLVP
ncbi:MAG: hypothetical protein AMXMBFR53_36670 [Gemmatimonadota bacterium]